VLKPLALGDLLSFAWHQVNGMIPPERFADTQTGPLVSVRFIAQGGANHKNFAIYSQQLVDNDTILDPQAQIDFANDATVAFFAEHF
jgi:hypothetical protein